MGMMGSEQLGSLVETIKTKVMGSLKKTGKKGKKKPYVKMEKSSSVKVEIRSRKARQIIEKTLKAADRHGKDPLPTK